MRISLLILLLSLVFSFGKAQNIVDDFTVVDTEGQTHNLYSYLDDGKIVVLDFFYVGCSYCQFYSVHIQESYEHFGCNKGDVVFLGIDWGDTDAEVQTFDSTYGIEYPSISGLEGGGDSIVSAFNITFFTTLLVIDTNRQIIKSIKPPTTPNIDSFLVLVGAQKMPCNVGVDELEAGIKPYVLNPLTAGSPLLLSVNQPGTYQFQLMDMSGRILEAGEQVLSKGQNTLQNKTDYPPGMYILRVHNRLESASLKLIIQ